MNDGFLSARVELTQQLSGIDPQFSDDDHLMKLLVGWKSSNRMINCLQILCNNLDTGCQQNECTRVGFAYSTIKTQQEKKTKKYTHSLYENVSEYSSSVCGTYINVDKFKDGLPHTVEFEVNIPFDDLLAFGAFDLFLNNAVGEITPEFYVNSKGLVWRMLSPSKVKDYKELLQGETVNVDTSTSNLAQLYRHSFTQINNRAPIINKVTLTDMSGIKVVDASSADCLLQCTGMRILTQESNMFGCKVRDSSRSPIRQYLSSPVVIPSQQLDYYVFPIGASQSGIQSTVNIHLTNVTCISVMLPKYPNDFTVFENPIYTNVQLTIDGVVYKIWAKSLLSLSADLSTSARFPGIRKIDLQIPKIGPGQPKNKLQFQK